MRSEFNIIDLFAGCGGLLDGFEANPHFKSLASVEWEPMPCQTLRQRLRTKWMHKNADEEVMQFDIQRTRELFHGFNDLFYGQHKGLDALIGSKPVDVIIGGPPCQAYSLAGRIRDPNGMRNDYRNYLFESYIKVLRHYRPKCFVFENVVGLLSACPGDTPIRKLIAEAFDRAGYRVIDDFSKAVFDVADFGVPQHRKRIIIFGIQKGIFRRHKDVINKFYGGFLPAEMKEHRTVRDAIGDMPSLLPLKESTRIGGVHLSHSLPDNPIPNHIPRFHNNRDISTFKLLAKDIEDKRFEYTSIESLKALYTKLTGRKSNIHKYYVLRWNEPSNTIPAHLHKDGMRHIHPDSKQARTITVREAARLQSFDDDFVFLGSQSDQYKMIGNAVPPEFSKAISNAVYAALRKVL